MSRSGPPLALTLALALGGVSRAAAPTDPEAQIARLKVQVFQLARDLEALRGKVLGLGPGSEADALTARLEAIEETLVRLGAGAGGEGATEGGEGQTADPREQRVQALEEALEELKNDLVTRDDLKRYQLKPDEREYKSRTTQELELRVAEQSYRQAEIERRLDRVDGLVLDEELRPTVEALGKVAALFLANDEDVRARASFRFYWEANRFLAGGDLLFVYAMPEIMVFAQRHDIDRFQLDRDYTEPRDRFALRLKKAALGAQLGDLRLVGGVLQFTYGAGFFLNPTNPFTPKHVLDPRREVDGIPAAQIEWTLVASEGFNLSTQVTAVSTPVRNDVSGDGWHELAWGGFWQLKMDTEPLSLSAIAIYQQPDAIGRDAASFGGTLSFAPFGVTTSVEALVRPDIHGTYRPELVASLQGFIAGLGANGTTWIAEYYYNGHGLRSEEALMDELVDAIEHERALYAAELLTRALSRSHYLNLYLEPSLSTEITANVAALVGLEEGGGVLARFGLDWELASLTVHAYGGFTWGAASSELATHVLESFAELALSASF
jgi:hypothetical protein